MGNRMANLQKSILLLAKLFPTVDFSSDCIDFNFNECSEFDEGADNIEGSMSSLGCRNAVFNLSPVYETEPWGNNDQPWFLNCILEIRVSSEFRNRDSEISAFSLKQAVMFKFFGLTRLIEKLMGRDTANCEKWAERIIDIDLLVFDDMIYNSSDLVVPHPFITKRMFVLKPLYDILPRTKIPGFSFDLEQLIELCEDNGIVKKYQPIYLLQDDYYQ